jgi:hypothetical protein
MSTLVLLFMVFFLLKGSHYVQYKPWFGIRPVSVGFMVTKLGWKGSHANLTVSVLVCVCSLTFQPLADFREILYECHAVGGEPTSVIPVQQHYITRWQTSDVRLTLEPYFYGPRNLYDIIRVVKELLIKFARGRVL